MDTNHRILESTEENVNKIKENKLPIGWGGVILFFITFFGLVFVTGTLLGIVSIVLDGGVEGFYNDLFMQSHYLLLLDASAFFIAILLFKKVRAFLKNAFSLAPLRKGKTYVLILVAFVFTYVIQFFIMHVFQWEDGTSQVDTFGLEGLSDHWLSLTIFYIAFTFLTPIKEEVIYRGIIHRFLGIKWNFWIGLCISSLIFGSLHTGHVLSATIMGAVFVVLYRLTNSLVVPILLHILWNIYAITGLLYYIDIL
ncbi:type II CAAX endopeptidase family protein [Gracilibacillus sp. YIM 98692]|uniref:CPBP family intramembrane glutamic endopeptidase n=1 Tax=Gracilibacillus sp. YIM 98692 TaxID=2663532 RepID=UPI001F088E8F|nr:type II CAAX endopeptidase family protein [Gracilibacillus sp. YIM 98692]